MRNKVGTICMIGGAMLVLAALSLFFWNQRENRQADACVREILPQVVESIEGQQADGNKTMYLDPYDPTMKSVEIDGHAYVGYLSIPALGLELPVMEEWSYPNLKISPCRYNGSVKTDDFVIAAHNYSRHFGKISSLSQGDTVMFTDMNGIVTVYEVAELEVLAPTAVEEMTAGEYALTLFTCTYGGQSRVTVRCMRAVQEWQINMKKTLYEFCIENGKEELLRQWDKEANGALTPQTVSYGSGKKAWWCCEKGHTWQAVINSRSNGCGCPVCAGKQVLDGSNDLATEFPKLASQWHPSKNLPLTPEQVTRGSHRSVWWCCEKGHEWKAVIKSRVEGSGCPICAGRKLLVGENDLATCRPDLVSEWNAEKNGALKPDMVLATATRRVWWRCEWGHEWQARVKDRMDGKGCPYCSGQKVAAGMNDLASCYPQIAAQWHPAKNGKLTPQDVPAGSNRRVWWQCRLGHVWQTTVYSRTQEKTDCPYCTNRKVLRGFNDLRSRYPQIAAQWHPAMNGSLKPEEVTVGSRKKAWWICPEGHIWKTVVYSRTGSRKTGCPVCAGNVNQKKQKYYEMLQREAGACLGEDMDEISDGIVE